ncbi:MAG: hypothetical protein JWL60_97 [Gemmatimonadetes bacterium]|jgi:hypothetical protein|nr:hypothetical protein [Gemmatimonadota bacterium]
MALGLLLALTSALPAQYAIPHGVVSGSRVRVTLPGLAAEPFIGRALAFGGDSLLLEASSGRARARIHASGVARVEVSEGHDRLGTAWRYGAAGAAVGAVIGVLSLRDEGPDTFGMAPLAGGFAGAVLGGGIGAAVGAVLAPERWRTVWAR